MQEKMKCPKCGSDNITCQIVKNISNFHREWCVCQNCGHVIPRKVVLTPFQKVLYTIVAVMVAIVLVMVAMFFGIIFFVHP